MKWITTDCASGLATQSALPRPNATPPAFEVMPAIGSSVDESQSSFGGMAGPAGSFL
jgi:hypothetical protein